MNECREKFSFICGVFMCISVSIIVLLIISEALGNFEQGLDSAYVETIGTLEYALEETDNQYTVN